MWWTIDQPYSCSTTIRLRLSLFDTSPSPMPARFEVSSMRTHFLDEMLFKVFEFMFY